MAYRILGLDPAPFQHLFGRSDAELAAHGARRYVVDQSPGFPDRIEVRDAAPGETVILINYTHQPAATPYRSSHAIFVREGAVTAYDQADRIPDVLRVRPISLRAFDEAGDMLDADLCDGEQLEALIERFFENPDVSYLHAHYAKRGCYAARIVRG